jgi:hypothetical protein
MYVLLVQVTSMHILVARELTMQAQMVRRRRIVWSVQQALPVTGARPPAQPRALLVTTALPVQVFRMSTRVLLGLTPAAPLSRILHNALIVRLEVIVLEVVPPSLVHVLQAITARSTHILPPPTHVPRVRTLVLQVLPNSLNVLTVPLATFVPRVVQPPVRVWREPLRPP